MSRITPQPDLLEEYIVHELKRSGASWLKWVLASVLTLVGSALGAGYAAGMYLEEMRQRATHAEYIASKAAECCVRQTERIDTLKER